MKGGDYVAIFEMSSKADRDGRRHFRVILHEVFPDSCVDLTEEAGALYNENGITWLEQYSEAALPTLVGKSIRCEFLDSERTEIWGHGLTDMDAENGAIFENATMIGTFTNGYIANVEINGETKRVCIGEGNIDAACYHNFVEKLEKDMAEGNPPAGSVEIQRTDGNEAIIYKYGYKDKGRIPMVYEYSGFALLGVRPADPSSKLIELNNKEGVMTMDKDEIKVLIEQTVAEINSAENQIAQCKADCDARIAEANAATEIAVAERNEAQAAIEQAQSELETLRQEYAELNQKYETLQSEKAESDKALAEAQAKERIGELNSAIAEFTDEERAYAQGEIDAFNAEPITTEINSVVAKIYEGIGKNAKATEKKQAEQNEANDTIDIFSDMPGNDGSLDDVNIF